MRMRETLLRVLLVAPLLAGTLALGGSSPAAAAQECDTGPFGNNAFTGVVKDSLVVRAGKACLLNGAVVRGGITVEAGAILSVALGAEIRGSVSASSPRKVSILDSVVRGSVTVTGFTGGDEAFAIDDSEVRGDIVVTGFTGTFVQVVGSTVRGSLIFTGNTSVAGLTYVGTNVIAVNLECSGNAPLPIYGGGNTVGGTASGECAGLVAP